MDLPFCFVSFRAAEFICELAFVDLLTENIDETAAKISDLQSILGTTNTSVLTTDATVRYFHKFYNTLSFGWGIALKHDNYFQLLSSGWCHS